MDRPGELMAAWLRERGFQRNHSLDVWEYRLPGGQPPIRISDLSLDAMAEDIVPTVKQEIERTLASAGVGR